MTTRKKSTPLTEEQIDELVTAQADNDDAWGKPVQVDPYHHALSLRMPGDLFRRTALQARKEGFSHVEDWVMHLLTVAVKPEPDASLMRGKSSPYTKKKS